MKWVTRGTILAVAPFTLFYIIPYLRGDAPALAMKVSVLSLVFLPLTFGYAIFRYRLMDVDLIFKRGMAYTIAAGAITAAYFAAVGMASRACSTRTSRAPDRSALVDRHCGHGAAVRSVQELGAGVSRQVLLSQAL